MLKFFGCFFILITTVSIGIYCSDKLKGRVKALRSLEYMFNEILILVRYQAMTVKDIMIHLKNNSVSDTLSFIKLFNITDENDFYGEFKKSIEKSDIILNSDEKKLLISFGSALGSSDIEGQLSTIEVYRHDFRELQLKACAEYEKKSKLYRSLGVISGAFIIIMII